jgi:hypothetical protein
MIRLSALALLVALAAPAWAQAPAAPAAQANAAATSAWPQQATADGVTYVMNAPAYTAISGNTVSMRASVQVRRGNAVPVDGTVEMSAVMAHAQAPGYVELSDFQLSSCTMPDGSGATVQAALTSLLNGVGVESLLSNIVQGVALDSSRDVSGMSNEVPAIRVTERPTILISVNGKPVLGACGDGSWNRVVNTPSILLKSPDGTWYTRVGGTQWLSSDQMQGGYVQASAPPADVVQDVGRQPRSPVGSSGQAPPAAGATPPGIPDVIVATVPTLVVSVDGAPRLQAACDGVQWASNCAAPLLFSGDRWWTIGSGRWFSTDDLMGGTWSYVPAKSLPASFASLPATGPLASARASVPGTLEANSAAAASGIIRAITVPRTGAQCSVRYHGQPQFRPLDGGLAYATNSSQPVIQCNGAWYCCDDGAWYQAAAQSGPWTVCDSVPAAIYSLPPSCPAYACTYVSVVASSPDSVTFGSSGGYMGTYMQDGVPVYGTGYDYNRTDPQPADPSMRGNPNYVAPSCPSTYGNQAQYSYDTGTYAPAPGYGYYDYADMYPSVYENGYGGWGWSPYWGCAYGYGCGWGYGYGYGGWGAWNRGWNNWGNRRDWNRAANNVANNHPNAENRWSNYRDGGRTDGQARNGSFQQNRYAARGEGGMASRSPEGWHSPSGERGTSGFGAARCADTGGYRCAGGGRRGGGGRR